MAQRISLTEQLYITVSNCTRKSLNTITKDDLVKFLQDLNQRCVEEESEQGAAASGSPEPMAKLDEEESEQGEAASGSGKPMAKLDEEESEQGEAASGSGKPIVQQDVPSAGAKRRRIGGARTSKSHKIRRSIKLRRKKKTHKKD